MIRIVAVFLSVLSLVACGEKEQSASSSQPDAKAWEGTANVHTAKGYTPGQKAAWENQLRARAQAQNEYLKVN
ncbi:MAG: hypothetical protein WA191_04695 [Telluria sp.]|nr:hypothetical protein [Telluria sp.]